MVGLGDYNPLIDSIDCDPHCSASQHGWRCLLHSPNTPVLHNLDTLKSASDKLLVGWSTKLLFPPYYIQQLDSQKSAPNHY